MRIGRRLPMRCAGVLDFTMPVVGYSEAAASKRCASWSARGTSYCPRPAPEGPKGPGVRAVWTRPSMTRKTYLGRQAKYAVCVCLLKVDTLERMRIWNELMLCEHPQGAGPLVGAQMRYLIGSEHGWLGGLGFGAAALQLADREQWIGWDVKTRREHLHRIVGLSRFLIRASVRCHNLASCVLGMVLRRIDLDFDEQFGYRPWLIESFVEIERFAGTSYQAANWIEIGQTKGRGRQDREHSHAKSVKAIYKYPLQADFRQRLGGVEPVVASALGLAEGVEGEGWAQQEFGGAKLRDRRLSERLVQSARTLATRPGQAFSGVARGDWAAVKGYHRLIDQPDDSQVSVQAILAPHHARTVQRMKAHQTVLCIQDRTDPNYTGPPVRGCTPKCGARCTSSGGAATKCKAQEEQAKGAHRHRAAYGRGAVAPPSGRVARAFKSEGKEASHPVGGAYTGAVSA